MITRYIIKSYILNFISKNILKPFGFTLCKDCSMIIYDEKYTLRCYECKIEHDEYFRDDARRDYDDEMRDRYESRYDLD